MLNKPNLQERNKLAADQPDVNVLDVGGGGQLSHHRHENGRHHQHRCQVGAQGGLKVLGLEEYCGNCDHHK